MPGSAEAEDAPNSRISLDVNLETSHHLNRLATVSVSPRRYSINLESTEAIAPSPR
ncbi:MAG: hypothetical protein WBA43_11625 [Elainellaceae cyanobacterium]